MKTFGSSKSFFSGAKMKWETIDPGVKRKIMGYDDKIMMVHVIFEKGGVGSVHKHHHSQVSYVSSGVFEITIDGETQKLEEGDSFYVPPNTLHGAFCVEAGELIDVFSPIREDFML